MNEQKYDPPDEPRHPPPPPPSPPPGPPSGPPPGFAPHGYTASGQPIYVSITQSPSTPSAPRSSVANVKAPIGYYRGLKPPQAWLSDINNYVQLTEFPAAKWAHLLANLIEDPRCKAAVMEAEKMPYEDDYQHFTLVTEIFLDWFRTTGIESDNAMHRLTRMKKQVDGPIGAFVSRFEQCVLTAHPTDDLGERDKIRLITDGLEPDINRTWRSNAVQYQGEGFQTTT
jgi:hypothetical protein